MILTLCNRTCGSQSGAGLVEVAVAILVLSIGAIGLASLQISAKRAGYEAMQRTEASSLAMEIFERMRANPDVLDDYEVAAVGSAARSLPTAPDPQCIGSTDCTAAELAAWDLWEWERALNGGTTSNSVGGLVNPTGCITLSGPARRLVSVEIAWQGFEVLDNDSAGTGCGTGSYDSASGVTDGNRQLLQMVSYVGEG